MKSWLAYLRRGLSHKQSRDRLASQGGYAGILSNFKNLTPFLMKRRCKGLAGIFLVALTSLLSLPQPLITRYIIDDVILNRELAHLTAAILLLGGVTLGEKLAGLLNRFYLARFEQEVILDIQNDILKRTLHFPKSFFDQNETGYLMSRLSSDVQELHWFFSGSIAHILGDIFLFIGGVIFLFYLDWQLAAVILLILPGLVACVWYFSLKMRGLSHQTMEQHADVFGCLHETLSSASLIKAFSSEASATERMMSKLRSAFSTTLEQIAVSSLAGLAGQSIPGLARLLVLAWGAFLVIQGHWTLGSLLAFQAYLGHVFGPAQSLASANIELQNALAALQRVSSLFDVVPEENMGTGRKIEHLAGEIELRNVCFSYDGLPPVLEDISFHVSPGEHVAIAGPSGVGKTTLISLLLRFYRPTSGEIYFDGRPASDYELGSLRRRIGYVAQSTLLLSGTIMENLRYGNAEASHEEVLRAARTAGIHDFITSLQAGYDSRLGEQGINLSEGQKQRISIARALVKDPDILVLDEPSAALDSLTEQSILQSLPALTRKKTLFMVTHRLTAMKEADRIIVLDENRIAAMGTHRFLLETSPYYRALAAHQQMTPGSSCENGVDAGVRNAKR